MGSGGSRKVASRKRPGDPPCNWVPTRSRNEDQKLDEQGRFVMQERRWLQEDVLTLGRRDGAAA